MTATTNTTERRRPPSADRHPDADRRTAPPRRPGPGSRSSQRPADPSSARAPPRTSSDADVERLGQELDALRDRIIATRGAKDAAYIRRVIRVQRTLEVAGRATLLLSRKKTAFVAGTAMLSVAKILENMEIGHNVLHGQWDWMRDPDIHSTTWEWDFVTPGRGVEAHAQRPAPHVDQRARQGQGRGLLHAAHGRGPAVAAAQHPQPGHQRASWRPSSSGASRSTTSSSRRGRRARSPPRTLKRDLKAVGRKVAAPVHQGLRRDARSPPRRSAPASRRSSAPSRPTRSATSGPTRSSSAATSPTVSTSSPRRRSRARPAATGTSARCSARPTSPAASSCTS